MITVIVARYMVAFHFMLSLIVQAFFAIGLCAMIYGTDLLPLWRS